MLETNVTNVTRIKCSFMNEINIQKMYVSNTKKYKRNFKGNLRLRQIFSDQIKKLNEFQSHF